MENGSIALLHNHFDAGHLATVVAEMKTMGTPTIRVLDLEFENMYQAIEGCHRLRACEILGITPNFEYVDGDATVEELGLDYNNGSDPSETRACEIGDWENYQIVIENGELVKPENQE